MQVREFELECNGIGLEAPKIFSMSGRVFYAVEMFVYLIGQINIAIYLYF